MRTNLVAGIHAALRIARAAGPYLLVELVLPGGTLVALVLYLHRNGHLRRFGEWWATAAGVLRTAGGLFDGLAFAWQPPARLRCGECGPLLPTGC